MRAACVAFAAGAWWLQQQATLVDGRLAAVGAVAAFGAALVAGAAGRAARGERGRTSQGGARHVGVEGTWAAEADDRAAGSSVARTDRAGSVDAGSVDAELPSACHRRGEDAGRGAEDAAPGGEDAVRGGAATDGAVGTEGATSGAPGADADRAAGVARPQHRRAEAQRDRPTAATKQSDGRGRGAEALHRCDGVERHHGEHPSRRPKLCRLVAALVPVVAAFVVGFAWADWRAERRIADALPRALEGRDVVVVGTVATLPSVDASGTRFEFAVESVVSRDAGGRRLAVPRRLALGWYRRRAGPSRTGVSRAGVSRAGVSVAGVPGAGVSGAGGDADAVPDVRPGQRWRLTVRLKRPHGAANPFGFDYEYWLLEAGLRATGYVRPGADPSGDHDADDADGDDGPAAPDDSANEALAERADRATAATSTRKLAEFVWTPMHVVERARAALRDRVLTVLADGGSLAANAPYAGVIVALIVGDQRAIAQSDWVVFNRTGIGHLVSISGLHVSMLAALGSWLTFAAWRRRPAWCARIPAHRAAALAGTTVALVYCLLAGFGVPAQRTLYMIGIVAIALWTGRIVSISRVLVLALAAVVALDPWAVTGSGLWLSFAAVASIFYVASGRLVFDRTGRPWSERATHALRAAARVQWAVTLALTPLTLLFFYQVSLIGPVANAVAIPVVSFLVTPLALAGAVLPGTAGAWLLFGAHGLVALLATWLQWLSAAPVAVWTGAAPGTAAFAVAMVGVVWWLAPRGVAARWSGALWLLPLFVAPPDRPPPGTARFTALDVGQGTAVLVETATTDTLYDTGPVYSADNDAGNRIIVPYLRARGVDRLETLVVSHNDNDHSGGALSVLQAIDVVETRSSLALDTPIVRASRYHVRCRPGQSWQADGVSFTLIAPSPDVYLPSDGTRGKAAVKPNAKSCVLRVEAGGHAMLLTADIEKPQEAALVERQGAHLHADAMLVPHHGSRTSSGDAFLDAVRPDVAIVQAGYLNRFGHPRPDVLARYDARAITVLRNDRDGAITLTLGPSGVQVERYRDTHRRYWYDR